MSEFVDENGLLTDEFREALPEILGDDYYNDPKTKQEPTKIFDQVKDLKTLTKNYINGQRAYSKKMEGTVKVPTETSSPEEIKAFRTALGVPDSEKGYELPIPDDELDKEGFNVIAGEVRKAALEAGMPSKMVRSVWGKVVAAVKAQNMELEKKGLALIQKDEDDLRAELKEKYEPFIKDTDTVLAKIKTGPEVSKLLDTFGIRNHPAIRKMLAEIAPLVLEGHTVGGTGGEQKLTTDGFPTYKYDAQGKPIE
jgi:hypothetical protein